MTLFGVRVGGGFVINVTLLLILKGNLLDVHRLIILTLLNVLHLLVTSKCYIEDEPYSMLWVSEIVTTEICGMLVLFGVKLFRNPRTSSCNGRLESTVLVNPCDSHLYNDVGFLAHDKTVRHCQRKSLRIPASHHSPRNYSQGLLTASRFNSNSLLTLIPGEFDVFPEANIDFSLAITFACRGV